MLTPPLQACEAILDMQGALEKRFLAIAELQQRSRETSPISLSGGALSSWM